MINLCLKGSKLAIHANRITPALYEHVAAAAAQGTPLAAVKLTQEFTGLKAVKERSPNTLTVARAVAPHDGMGGIHEIGDGEVDLWADSVLQPLYEFVAHNPDFQDWVDVWELINEADPEGDRGYLMLGKVLRRCVEKANADFPLLSWGIGSFNMGTPEYSEMQAFIASGIFDLPDIVLCLHEGVQLVTDPMYKWHSTEPRPNPDPYPDIPSGLILGAPAVPEHGGALYGRVTYWSQLLGERMPPTIITEAYLHAYGDVAELRRRAEWVDELYSQLWYVVAWMPFTHSPTERWRSQDYTPAYPALIEHMDNVKDRVNAVKGEQEEHEQTLEEWVWQQALAESPTNEDAALQKELIAAGYIPYGRERWRDRGEGAYAIQPAMRWETRQRAVAYSRVPEWEHVVIITDPAGRAEVSLNVPYLSQWTPTAHLSSGDCGPACVAMIASYHGQHVTVNAAAAACGQLPGSKSASINQLRQGLIYYGVANEFRRPVSLDRLRELLDERKPVILLIHYGAIPGRQDIAFTGGHFFLAVGYGEDENGAYFLINDPNFWGARIGEGDHRRVAAADLEAAMEQATRDGNYARQGIVAMGAAPAVGQAIDMLPYLAGDGRMYEVRNAQGGQERFQTQRAGNTFYQTKNMAWEMLSFDEAYIYRDVDTSPGGGRFYRLWENGQPGSRWIPRRWRTGESFTQARRVQFYRRSDCMPSSANSGEVVDTMRFVERYASFTFRSGLTLSDVIKLEWVNGGELYYYARDYGLVAWERKHYDPATPQWSAISEVHAPGSRADNVREVVGCL